MVHYPGVLAISKREVIDETVFTILFSWGNKWFNQAPTITTTYNEKLFGKINPTESDIFRRFHGGLVTVNENLDVTFFKSLTSVDATSFTGIDKTIISECTEVVLNELFESFAEQLSRKKSFDVKRKQWVASINVTIKEIEFCIFLEAEFFLSEQLENSSVTKIKPVDVLFSGESIELEAKFKNVSITGEQLSNLKVGQIINLKHPLSQPIPFDCNNSITELEGFLVNKNNKKSIYLTGNK